MPDSIKLSKKEKNDEKSLLNLIPKPKNKINSRNISLKELNNWNSYNKGCLIKRNNSLSFSNYLNTTTLETNSTNTNTYFKNNSVNSKKYLSSKQTPLFTQNSQNTQSNKKENYNYFGDKIKNFLRNDINNSKEKIFNKNIINTNKNNSFKKLDLTMINSINSNNSDIKYKKITDKKILNKSLFCSKNKNKSSTNIIENKKYISPNNNTYNISLTKKLNFFKQNTFIHENINSNSNSTIKNSIYNYLYTDTNYIKNKKQKFKKLIRKKTSDKRLNSEVIPEGLDSLIDIHETILKPLRIKYYKNFNNSLNLISKISQMKNNLTEANNKNKILERNNSFILKKCFKNKFNLFEQKKESQSYKIMINQMKKEIEFYQENIIQTEKETIEIKKETEKEEVDIEKRKLKNLMKLGVT